MEVLGPAWLDRLARELEHGRQLHQEPMSRRAKRPRDLNGELLRQEEEVTRICKHAKTPSVQRMPTGAQSHHFEEVFQDSPALNLAV